MPWTSLQFVENTNINNTGSLTAIHDSGFTFTRERINAGSSTARNQFVTDARAAYSAWLTEKNKHDTIKAEMLTALNAP